MGALDRVGRAVGGAVGSLAGGFAEGAGLTAEPYDPDPAAFRDPRLAANRRRLDARIAGLDAGSPGSRAQEDVVRRLTERAEGRAPSVAERQLLQTTDRNVQQILGTAASAGGGTNPALVHRQAINAVGEAQQEAAGQAATLRAREQSAAEQALAQAVATQQRMELAREQMVQGYLAQGLSMDQAQFLANQDLERLRAELATQTEEANVQARAGVVGGLLQGGGAALGNALSDERAKTDIEPGEEAIQAVMDKLRPYAFRYKDPTAPGATDGRLVGVMAQDLAKTKGGRDIVFESDGALMLDPVEAVSAALASSADLHHRVKALEARNA